MKKRLWIFCGSDQPQKAYPPFMLASGALALDMDVTLFFTMDGLHIVEKGGAEKIRLNGEPHGLSSLMETVREGGGKMIACSALLEAEGLREEDIIDGVEFGGVATFVSGAEEADVVLTF
ncbi:MAG: DsrE/DsrF/DrsH-like family protein [Gemmatimonadales bacterium]